MPRRARSGCGSTPTPPASSATRSRCPSRRAGALRAAMAAYERRRASRPSPSRRRRARGGGGRARRAGACPGEQRAAARGRPRPRSARGIRPRDRRPRPGRRRRGVGLRRPAAGHAGEATPAAAPPASPRPAPPALTVAGETSSPTSSGSGGAVAASAPPAELVERRVGRQALGAKLGTTEPLFEIQVLAPGRLAGARPGEGAARGAARRLRRLRRREPPARLGPADPRRRVPRLGPARAPPPLRPPPRDRPVPPGAAAGRQRERDRRPAEAADEALRGGERPALRGAVAAAAATSCRPSTGQSTLLPLGKVETETAASGWSASRCATPSSPTWPAAAGSARPRRRSASSSTSRARVTAASSSTLTTTRIERDQGLPDRGRAARARGRDQPRRPRRASRAGTCSPSPAARRARAAGQVDAVVDAFASALRWDEVNARALNLTTQAAQALVDLARQLPAELAPTIFEIPVLLERRRAGGAAVLPHVSPPVRQFFEERFPRLAPGGDHPGHEPDRPPAGGADRGRPVRQPGSRPTTSARRWTGG